MKSGDIEIGHEEFHAIKGAYRLSLWLDIDLFNFIKKEAELFGVSHLEYLKKHIKSIGSTQFLCKERHKHLGSIFNIYLNPWWSKEEFKIIQEWDEEIHCIPFPKNVRNPVEDFFKNTIHIPEEFEKVFVENEKDILA